MNLLLLLSGLLTGCTENVIGKIDDGDDWGDEGAVDGDDGDDGEPSTDDGTPTDTGEPATDDGTPVDTGEPATDDGTPVDTGEPATDDGTPVDTGEPATDDGTPVDTGEPATDDGTPVDTGEPATDDGTPVDTGEPATDGGPPIDTGESPTDTGEPPTDTGEPATVPIVTELTLLPDPAYTNDLLTATASASDGASISWAWSIDGDPIPPSGDSLTGTIWFNKHHDVAVTATPSLAGVLGEAMTASIVISNSPPGAPAVAILPAHPVAGTDDLRCTLLGASEDDDSDPITYSATWSVDGAAYTGSTDAFSGDTAPASATTAGEIWTCIVTPNDGEDNGSSASASTMIETPVLEEVCTDNLISVGTPTIAGDSRPRTGNWGPDHHIGGLSGYWVFEKYEDEHIREYTDLSTIEGDSTAAGYALEDDWAGTGQIVFNGSVYYQEEGESDLVRYDVNTRTELARNTIPGAGTDADFNYAFGGKTSIDFDTDGDHLYVIHSSTSVGGRFQVTRVNPETLAVISTDTAPAGIKTDHGNAFIACGVLYATHEEFYRDGTINYAWKLGTGLEWDPGIAWEGMGYFTAAQYSPVDDTIYAYDDGHLLTFSPTWGP